MIATTLFLAVRFLVFQDPPLTPAEARSVFAEAGAVAAADGGRLWGRSIAGPLMIVDLQSGNTYASQPDRDGRFTPIDGVFRGRLPETVIPANTAVEYAGERWTMVIWPLPADSAARRQLLAHELWHRIQLDLGFPLSSPDGGHLDSETGRVWFRLEARSLEAALEGAGPARIAALHDALAFRAARAESIPGSDTAEAALERNEGLAEYTGYRLSGRTEPAQRGRASAALQRMETGRTIGRSFAYATGPAYGLLLDDLRPDWRSELGGGASLPTLAARATGWTPGSTDRVAAERRYGGADVREAEAAREIRRQTRMKELVARLVDGPVLRLPLDKADLGFDPGRIETLEGHGTVYGGLRLSDAWGVLDAAESEGLMNWPSRAATVAVDESFDPAHPAGPGWRVSLAPGWRIVAAPNGAGWVAERIP